MGCGMDSLSFVYEVWILIWGCFKGLGAGIIWRLLHFHLCLLAGMTQRLGSVGTVDQSTYNGLSMQIGLLPVWNLNLEKENAKKKSAKRSIQRVSVPRELAAAAWHFTIHPQKSRNVTSTLLYWLKQSQAHSESREGAQTPHLNGRYVKELEDIF